MEIACFWLYAIYYVLSATAFSVVALAVWLCTFLFDPNRRVLHRCTSWWAFHHVLTCPPLRWSFEGRENISASETYIFVANHQSLIDIPMLYGLHVQFKWVAKDILFRLPPIGLILSLNQYVPIKRGSSASARKMMLLCQSWLTKGVSIMLFPEGTRSEHGHLRVFKDGAFRLAIDCGVPVVPVVVDGTRDTLRKGCAKLHVRARIKVRVLRPVYPQVFNGDWRLMRSHVHQVMSQALADARSGGDEMVTCAPQAAVRAK